MADVYCLFESSKKNCKIWKIYDLVSKAGTTNLPFMHAWSGCDTTSATYGHGKATLLKKMKESEEDRYLLRWVILMQQNSI